LKHSVHVNSDLKRSTQQTLSGAFTGYDTTYGMQSTTDQLIINSIARSSYSSLILNTAHARGEALIMKLRLYHIGNINTRGGVV